MLQPVLVCANDSGTCGDNLTWTYDETNKTLTISGNGTMSDYSFYGSSVVPWNQYKYDIITVNIEEGVANIGSYAFESFSSLTTITIPNSVMSIGNSAFSDCTALTSIILPNSITTIGSYSFYGCKKLLSITIPSSTETIGEYAFWNCQKISNLIIPKGVKFIGKKVFARCSGLLSISVEEGNNNYNSRNNCNAIIETSSDILITGCRNTIIPDGVVAIGDGAFEHCYELYYLEMPKSVVSLGEDAFFNCAFLASLDISNIVEIGPGCFNSCTQLDFGSLPEGLTVISEQSFSAIYTLETVTIPPKVKEIKKWAFWSNKYLSTVYIPENVEKLEMGVFAECKSLKDLYCYGKQLPNAAIDLFVTEYDLKSAKTDLANAVLHVPAQSLELYRTTKPWCDFGSIVALDDETGIIAATEEPTEQKQFFTLDGKRINNPQKGVNIVRMPNGRTKKIIAK